MQVLNYIALILNIIIVVLEIKIFIKVRKKSYILKYYTFLQNFIAVIASTMFIIFETLCIFNGNNIPPWIKGIRYTATCGLAATMFVFAFILAPRYKSGKSSNREELFGGVNPKIANRVLHFICPIISIISFVLFERQISIGSEWTSYAAYPSIIYWSMYILLTVTHLWKEPYGLTKNDKIKKRTISQTLKGIVLLLLIPIIFIGLEYLLWWLNTI